MKDETIIECGTNNFYPIEIEEGYKTFKILHKGFSHIDIITTFNAIQMKEKKPSFYIDFERKVDSFETEPYLMVKYKYKIIEK